MTAQEALERYRRELPYFLDKTAGHLNIAELRGKNLMCWCAIGPPCHADVLLEIANQDKRVGITVIFCCEAGYQATQQRARATGSFKCHECREILHSWAGRYNYLDWKPIAT